MSRIFSGARAGFVSPELGQSQVYGEAVDRKNQTQLSNTTLSIQRRLRPLAYIQAAIFSSFVLGSMRPRKEEAGRNKLRMHVKFDH
jgi:hypothetical protein